MSWVVVISTIAIGAGVATAGPAPSVNVAPVPADSLAMCTAIAKDHTGSYEVKDVYVSSKARCYGDGVEVPTVVPAPREQVVPRVRPQRYSTDLPPISGGHPADPRTIDGCYDPRTGADYCAQKCDAECQRERNFR